MKKLKEKKNRRAVVSSEEVSQYSEIKNKENI